MATIKVFSAAGVKELKCFDILDNVDFLSDIEEDPSCEPTSEPEEED